MESLRSDRRIAFLDWLSDYGHIYAYVFAFLVAVLAISQFKAPVIASAFGAGVVALRWASRFKKRSPYWLAVGIPGFLFFVWSSLQVIGRLA